MGTSVPDMRGFVVLLDARTRRVVCRGRNLSARPERARATVRYGLTMNSRVFLSHASEDRTIAERLCRFLESHGWRCWLAPRDLPTGSEWPEQILNPIEESAALVALISEHALRSDPVKNELAHAAQRRLQIFPLRIDGVALTPFFQFHLNRLHILSTTSGSLGQALKQLEDALRASSMPTAPPEPKARPSKARPERVPAPRAADGKQPPSSSASLSAP